MPVATPELDAQIVGREGELRALDAFLAGDASPRALVLTGAPGIGKTSLLEAGIALARERGLRVLSARGSGAETRLSSSALIDLLDGVGRDELGELPPPQLHALEVALLRAAPSKEPPEAHAIALGLLNALRLLAAREPLLVALDDVQWLDSASGDALAFCARRLDGEPIVFLLARRPEAPPPLERALAQRAPEYLEVGPLSFGATRRVLSRQLGKSLPRHVVRRVFEASLGNPLFAMEMGRALAASGLPDLGEEIPVPRAVEDLLGTRVAKLTVPVRRVLLAVALDADLRVAQLTALASGSVLEEAVDSGALLLDGDRVRPFHPLVAAAARTRARAADRRKLHLELAGVVGDEERRVLHLALATKLPDEDLAAALAASASAASAHGDARQAVILAEHSLRLTPADSPRRTERLLALAGYYEVAGERQRVTDLLTPEVDSLPPADRVRAWMRLSEGGSITSMYDSLEYLDRALAASEGDAILHAYVLAKKSHQTPAYVWQIPEAEAWALEALSVARRDGPVLERLALHGLGWARAMRGRPIDDVCEQFRVASDAATHITDSPEPVLGLRLLWRGEIEAARPILVDFLTLADTRGEEVSYALQRMQVCDLELRGGEWQAAERRLDEWESADRQLLIRATYERSRALLAVGRGVPEEAERLASSALASAQAGGYNWQMLESLRARGSAALFAGDCERAAEDLGAVWEHMQREGVDEPGAFPVAPELVEALVEVGRVEEARAVVDRLAALAEEQEHPWGLASAKRCRALLRVAAQEYDDEAATALAEAADAYGALGLRFDRAKALLGLGRMQRRYRKWGAARESLERAAEEFDAMGSPGWVEQTRSDLGRVGGRRPRSTGELTPTERRVVDLAADGLANKEIAQQLFVTVRTVEEHLKHAYAKLGIRSRTQLARRLSEL